MYNDVQIVQVNSVLFYSVVQDIWSVLTCVYTFTICNYLDNRLIRCPLLKSPWMATNC